MLHRENKGTGHIVVFRNPAQPHSQHNRFTSIECVADLPNLKFLAASHNKIEEVRRALDLDLDLPLDPDLPDLLDKPFFSVLTHPIPCRSKA
jgi:hypothetical protein